MVIVDNNKEKSMETKFEAGQTVYSENGEQAEYVAHAGDGHIVRPVVEAYGYDGESYEHICDPVTWRTVFVQPPVAKFSAELKALHEQIATAKAERQRLDNEDWQRRRERTEKLKRFAVLDNLELFIDGKITHYVDASSSYSPPEIIAIEDAKSSDTDRYRKTLRLLTLGGSIKDGNIYWELSQYSDGSGSGRGVQPCTSYEQAAEIVKAAIVKHFASGNLNEARESWLNAADEFGITVSDAYRRTIAQQKIKNIESNLDWKRQQADSYTKTFRDAEAELTQLRAYVNPTPATSAA
jgi:hypothetical protein